VGVVKLLLASNNPGKLAELSALLKSPRLDLVTPAEIGLALEVEEDGTTYAENAAKKARAFALASSFTAMADDTGLEVDALDGAPGLHSKRFAGRNYGSDAERRAALLQVLTPSPRPWRARFHATLAVATPDAVIRFAEGYCEGEIIPQERGTGGFGYDSIFLVEGLERTMAELPMEEKNRVSHRARAALAAGPILAELAASVRGG
jgi:XTP/dITP diphosphohydrolase